MYSAILICLALVVLCQFVALGDENVVIEGVSGEKKRCSYGHAFDYYGAYCAQLGLDNIPKLKTEIQILDFSENKLRVLSDNSFSDYTSLRRLYLTDNKIYRIEENALTPLTYLQSLDLSRNVITSIPKSLLNLPSLKKLHLSSNPLNQIGTNYAPIKAPLQYLDVSDCQVNKLERWGILPQLLYYNISYNPLTSLDVSHFVEMCSVRQVDMTKSTESIRVCDLKLTIHWLQQKKVDYLLSDDRLKSREFSSCPVKTISDDLNATHALCRAEYRVPVPETMPSRNTWARLCGGLAGFLVGFMLLLYLFHRYNVAKTKQAEKKPLPTVRGDKHSSELLLNETSA